MFPKVFWALVLVPLLEANAGFAQDPLKSESAHYKLAFENDKVQVVYIHYGPHEKSGMHQHPAGVVVNLSNGDLKFTDQNGITREVHAIHGEARWFPAVKHKVENISNVTYDGVYVGIKGDMARAAVDAQGAPVVLDDSAGAGLRPLAAKK
jgi:quercetin dioxygenase-like cupin family protein